MPGGGVTEENAETIVSVTGKWWMRGNGAEGRRLLQRFFPGEAPKRTKLQGQRDGVLGKLQRGGAWRGVAEGGGGT